jgi:hypothetical protein
MASMKTDRKKSLIICGAILTPSIVLGLYLAWIILPEIIAKPEILVGADSVDFLPENRASNISMIRMNGFETMEFNCSEQNFLEIAHQKSWTIQSIVGSEKAYSYDYHKISEPISSANMNIKRVKSGYISYEEYPSGGFFSVVYDKDLGKAFYLKQTR